MADVEVASEVAGTVWKLEVGEGDRVAAGDVLLVLESMKMEVPVEAPVAGSVVRLLVAVEDGVDEDQVVAVIAGD